MSGLFTELTLTVVSYFSVFLVGFIGGFALKDLLGEARAEEAEEQLREHRKKEEQLKHTGRRYL